MPKIPEASNDKSSTLSNNISVKKTEVIERPVSSFSLKKAFTETTTIKPEKVVEEKTELNTVVEARNVFDIDQLKRALEDFITKNKAENIISIALKSHQPIINDNAVLVQVDNQLQIDKLNAIKTSIQNYLMRTLNNGGIKLDFQLFDEKNGKEEKALITSQDKLEHFIKLNPVIEQMRKIFGMEFE